jgi:hypothetical protein
MTGGAGWSAFADLTGEDSNSSVPDTIIEAADSRAKQPAIRASMLRHLGLTEEA